MKIVIIVFSIGGFFSACSDHGAVNTSHKTAHDTITNVTNPGVGAAIDDTAVKD